MLDLLSIFLLKKENRAKLPEKWQISGSVKPFLITILLFIENINREGEGRGTFAIKPLICRKMEGFFALYKILNKPYEA